MSTQGYLLRMRPMLEHGYFKILNHRIEPLENTTNNRLFQARYRFNKSNFEKLTDELTPLFNIRRTAEACSIEQIVGLALELMAGTHFFG